MNNHTEYEYYKCRGACVIGYICGLALVSSLIGICFEFLIPKCSEKPKKSEIQSLVEDAINEDIKYYDSLQDIKA